MMIAMQHWKNSDPSYHSLHLYAASAVFKLCNKSHLIWNGSMFENYSCTIDYWCIVQGFATLVSRCQNSPCLFSTAWFRQKLQGEHHCVFKMSQRRLAFKQSLCNYIAPHNYCTVNLHRGSWMWDSCSCEVSSLSGFCMWRARTQALPWDYKKENVLKLLLSGSDSFVDTENHVLKNMFNLAWHFLSSNCFPWWHILPNNIYNKYVTLSLS
jgi:hypothetical protein